MDRERFARSGLALLGLVVITSCQSGATPESVAPPETTAPTQSDLAPDVPTPAEEPLTADTTELPIRVLFIGDSFTVGIGDFMEKLASSAEPPLIVEGKELTHPGMTLEGHWLTVQTVPTIQAGGWTAVVLQEDLSLEGIDLTTFHEYARNFDAEIEQVGAETILYMPWEYSRDNPMRIEQIASAYREIGTELGVEVAPVGLAWDRAVAQRPELQLYEGDGAHAGTSGQYLTLAVLYATIFDVSPVGLVGPPEMSEEDIVFLQNLAWESVMEYQ